MTITPIRPGIGYGSVQVTNHGSVSGQALGPASPAVHDATRSAAERRDSLTPASVTADFNASASDARHVERNTVAVLNEAAKVARDTARMPNCDPRHSTLYHRAAAALEAILEQM